MRKHQQPPTMFDVPAIEPGPGEVETPRPLNMADWSDLYLDGSMTLDDDGDWLAEDQAEFDAEIERIKARRAEAEKGVS